MRALEVHRSSGHQDLAGIALIGAGQDLHQRRLAGRVVADEAEDLARVERQIDIERSACTAPKALLDAAHLDDRVRSVQA